MTFDFPATANFEWHSKLRCRGDANTAHWL